MIDLYPHVRASLKLSNYFSEELDGFRDSEGRFKVFDDNEAPSTQSPFVTVEQEAARQSQNTDWADPVLIFHVTGKPSEKASLWAIAEAIRDYFLEVDVFAPITGDEEEEDEVQFQVTGEAEFSKGFNPVTEQSVVSVALRFGVVA